MCLRWHGVLQPWMGIHLRYTAQGFCFHYITGAQRVDFQDTRAHFGVHTNCAPVVLSGKVQPRNT